MLRGNPCGLTPSSGLTADELISTWLVGLASLCRNSAPVSRANILLATARMKTQAEAHSKGLTYRTHILNQLRHAGSPKDIPSSTITTTCSTRTSQASLHSHQIIDTNQLYAENASLKHKLAVLASENRSLRETISSLKGNIRVLVRIRPPTAAEVAKPVSVHCTTDDTVVCDFGDGRRRAVRLDGAFGPTSSQSDVYEGHIRELVHAVLDGYNSSVFAYGPTGSGKTYTVFGSPKSDAHTGLHERILRGLFCKRDSIKEQDMLLSMSMVEVYNESIHDLLAPGKPVVKVLSGHHHRKGKGDVVLEGLSKLPLATFEESLEVLDAALATRRTSTTNLNFHSSRSHCIVTLRACQRCPYTAVARHGKLNLIDLAGSENVGRSGAKGNTLREAQLINKSLSTLVGTIPSIPLLLDGRMLSPVHIPYRNSKLTLMLRDSLGGNARALMIAHVSPCVTDVAQTLSTLKFASRTRMVELGPASRNMSS
ncbi:hypothetical protein FOZ61_009980 [Perkinsus olseni]|uniref:Kinesin-like protein n=1 Tax=Perkinsus olseni TaxID=32597 RepID=A0A7J6M5F9_PEROL|nr:hypothetical protein FOZ61_009980 [Perkinsus olseni]